MSANPPRSKARRRLARNLAATSRRFLRLNQRWKRITARRGHCLFINAMPKSASTFLSRCLIEATGFTPFFLGDHHLNAQDLYRPNLIDSWSLDIVCHQHARATRPNLELIAEFRIRPVLLVRDLGDCLISLRDHLLSESAATPLINAPPDFAAWPKDRQHDFLIEIAGPWYAQFHADWARAIAKADVEALLVRYGEVAAAPAETVARILRFHGLGGDEAEIASAVAAAGAAAAAEQGRFNRGIDGRGAGAFSPEQQARLRGLARFHDDVDWTPLGLAD